MTEARLMLGSVQFGVDYGIANAAGLPAGDVVAAILDRADSRGINAVDTAVDYGLAERRLGAWPGLRHWQVVTKLPALPEDCGDVAAWVARQVEGSLARLAVAQLHGLLLHRPMQLLDGARGQALWSAMESMQDQGLVQRIGYSVYSPQDLEALSAQFPAQIVQAPFSVIDRRLQDSGWLARLHRSQVEVHVRSVFLQGLLLLPGHLRPGWCARWQPLWDTWHRWLHEQGLDAVTAALAFVLRQPGIGRVVVGVDSVAHLDQIMAVTARQVPQPPSALGSDDIDLLHPGNWPARVQHRQ